MRPLEQGGGLRITLPAGACRASLFALESASQVPLFLDKA